MQPNLLKVSLDTTKSHRAPNAARSDTVRNPIGRRTVHHYYYISSIDKPLYSMSYFLNLPVV